MQNTFDQFDAGVLSVCQKARYGLRGIHQGDFIKRKDGLLARVTAVWEDGAQTTRFSNDGGGGSFHLNTSGTMSYSGSLEPSVPKTHLRETSNYMKGRAWIWHHNEVAAHNGVDVECRCKVWELLDDSEAIDPAKPARYIIADGDQFRGSIQSSTYTTFDGVERVAYRNGQTLADYLTENTGCKVIESEELDGLISAYHNGLKTEPKAITEESYNDLLECLPPCRWQRIAGAEVFHVSERLTGNLVQWCFRVGESCYGFTDDAGLSVEALAAKIRAVLVAA